MPTTLILDAPAILVVSQLLVATVMLGLIWCVQVVIYPQFRDIGEPWWHDYHQHYMRRFACLVVPVMLLEMALAGISVLLIEERMFPIIGFLIVGSLWGSTGLIQVGLHRRLSVGFNPDIHRKLVATNWVRTLLWTGRWAFLMGWLWTLVSSS